VKKIWKSAIDKCKKAEIKEKSEKILILDSLDMIQLDSIGYKNADSESNSVHEQG
jgi:hypothetical protein